ncbi:MAG: DnaD domain protein [Oscillospiraceae bacterium]|nr:DnaD domain protein [Oscillospiraceae bacterium]
MAEKKFALSGPEAFTLSGQTIDRLIRAGDGDAALLYLYMLKTHEHSSPDEAAAAMGKSVGWAASAMAVLSQMGLIKSNDGGATDARQLPPAEGTARYTAEEIKREVDSGSDFSALVDEAQRSLGKIMSPDELERLFGIYDALRLPAEVIMLLITHCISESRGRGGGRMPSMRYIERAAYTWEREEIFSLEKAEEYLKRLEERKSAMGEMKTALLIKDRELSASEKRYIDGWIAMGFGVDAVEIAFDITVINTGKLSWGYINTILSNWHNSGLHSPGEIKQSEGKAKGGKPGENKGAKDQKQKFGAPDKLEIERMQRLLDKIKDG